jgi:hypothetical protein
MARLASQPAKKGALQEFDVKPIGLCPPVLSRHRDARGWVTYASTSRACSQRASQKSITASLECNSDTLDGASSLACFLPPARQKIQ